MATKRTVYVVSVEDDSSGMVDWYTSHARAEAAFEAECRNFPRSEVNLFPLDLEQDYPDETITAMADNVMWVREYTPLRWRPGPLHTTKVTHDVVPDCVPCGRLLEL